MWQLAYFEYMYQVTAATEYIISFHEQQPDCETTCCAVVLQQVIVSHLPECIVPLIDSLFCL